MPDLKILAAVGVGAGLGGMLRLLLTTFVVARVGPSNSYYATLFINVSGSAVVGFILEVATIRTGFSPVLRSLLTTGFLGGYTTFSTFSYETVGLFAAKFPGVAFAYAILSLVLGVLGAFLGIVTARSLAER